MGNDLQCVRSSTERMTRLPSNRFKVRNVNESGRVVNKGYLEVTSTDLILHVLNAEPVRWPLRCLRRYGYDANLFSFESGRRCATGPGIYAFKSKHAIQIFQLVQGHAQHPEDQTNGAATTSVASPTTANVTTTMRQRSLSNDAAPPQSQVVSRSSSHGSGMNGVHQMNGNLSSHASLSSNISHPPTSPSPLYFNGNGSIGNCSLRVSPISPTLQYVNASAFVDIAESPLEMAPSMSIRNGVIPEESTAHETSCDSYGDPALNYATLKLPTDEEKTNSDDAKKSEDVEEEEDEERSENGITETSFAVDDGLDRKQNDAKKDKIKDEKVGTKGAEDECEDGASGNVHTEGRGEGRDGHNMEEEKEDSEERKERKVVEDDAEERKDSRVDNVKDLSTGSDSPLDESQDCDSACIKENDNVKLEKSNDAVCDGGNDKQDVKLKDKPKGKHEGCGVDRAALLQDVVNGNIRPEKLKDRNGDMESKYNILVNYANLTEQQIQDVLQKLEANRNDNISPCTVCSTSSSNASQRVSPLSYYANLDTAGELPPNWQANGFQFYPELRTPRSTSSKGSTGSEFTFDVNRGSCSPVDHNYANLDTLPEVQPLRHSLSSSATNGAANWMILQPPPKGKMNYIQLDFDENDQPVIHNVRPLRRSMSSSASSTPPKTPVSPQQEFGMMMPAAKSDIYARIDIEKTVALANSHRQVEGDTDVSTRRTRHDVWTSNKSR